MINWNQLRDIGGAAGRQGLAGSDLISNFLILFSTYLIRLLSEAIFQVFTKILKLLESGLLPNGFIFWKDSIFVQAVVAVS